jgi:hypothetical protein
MNPLPERRLSSNCVLSERLIANLQPVIGLIESDWCRLRCTMDLLTESFLRQIHERLAKWYEAHVYPGAGRRS